MADNLKVNAKTKILTFKKKHNLLVEKMNNLLPPITESDIGKVLGVNDDGELEFQEVSSGTKLYLHRLQIYGENDAFEIFANIISSESNEYTISSSLNIGDNIIISYFSNESDGNFVSVNYFVMENQKLTVYGWISTESDDYLVNGLNVAEFVDDVEPF